MPPKLTLEDKLMRLNQLAYEEMTPEVVRELVRALGDSVNLVVARAATIMGRSGQTALLPELVTALVRLLRAPAAADKQCRAKEALVEALEQLGNPDPDPYFLGVRHVQLEPVYGGSADTAGHLRSLCAAALARMRHPDARLALCDLLTDGEPEPREAAVNGLVFLGGEASELLLRLKVRAGDARPDILGKCLGSLLQLDPERELSFVTGFLAAADLGLAEAAALALGESRRADAAAALLAHWEANTRLELRRALLLALALTRQDAAVDLLLEVIADESRAVAAQAVEALAIYAGDERLRTRIEAAVRRRDAPQVWAAYREAFE